MTESLPRFYIDRRGGCIAVLDRTLADPEHYPGLHEDTPGVVWFRLGILVPNPPCPTCGHSVGTHWEVLQQDVEYAEIVCQKRNQLVEGSAATSPTEVEAAGRVRSPGLLEM